MCPRPMSYGRLGTPVVPPGWGVSHAPVLAKTMTAVVDLYTGEETTSWSDDLDRTVTALVPAYAVGQVARIQALQTAASRQQAETAEESLEVTDYLITLPHDLQPEVGHLIEVTATDDTDLVGRVLQVAGVVRGSERFERDVYATLQPHST